jgi:hypothetical protein
MYNNNKNSNYIKKLFRYLIFAFITFNFTKLTLAQNIDKGPIINQQLWIDFYPHYYVNEKLEYYGDTGYRTIVSERNWSRLYIRPSLKYHFTNIWEFHSGLGLFYIYNLYCANNFEITPWQGVQLNWPKWSRLSFKHLIRLEERFNYETKNWTSDFEFRLRYKLSGKITVGKKWYIPFYGEFFLPLSNEIEEIYKNKERVGLGIGYKPNKELQISFSFSWQGSRAGINEDIHVSDYIYRIKIKKVWNRFFLNKYR